MIFCRMLVIKQFQVPLTSMFFVHAMEVNGTHNCLVTNILQYIFFCVQPEWLLMKTFTLLFCPISVFEENIIIIM